MIRIGAAVAVMAVVLGGCAPRGPQTPEERCERAANHEPNVAAMQDQMLGNISMQQELLPQIRAAKRQAYNDCMVRLGEPSQDIR
jgi:hypothetical protein